MWVPRICSSVSFPRFFHTWKWQLGEGWRLWSCWEKAENSSKCFGGFVLNSEVSSPGFPWLWTKGVHTHYKLWMEKRVFNMLKWCANVWHLPLKSVATVTKVILINDCEIRVLLISVAYALEELVEYSKLEELIECCPDFEFGLSWMYCVWKRSCLRKSRDSSCAWQCLIWDHSCLEKCCSFFNHHELQLKLCCCSPFF